MDLVNIQEEILLFKLVYKELTNVTEKSKLRLQVTGVDAIYQYSVKILFLRLVKKEFSSTTPK